MQIKSLEQMRKARLEALCDPEIQLCHLNSIRVMMGLPRVFKQDAKALEEVMVAMINRGIRT